MVFGLPIHLVWILPLFPFFFNVWISKSHLFLSLGHFFQVLTQQWIRFNNYMIPTKFVLLKNLTFHYDPEGKKLSLKI